MSETPEPKPTAPRPVTRQSLENAALHYLERFATSRENLRRVLQRKVARAAARGADPADGAALIEDILVRYESSGLLDDRAYAAQAAASLVRRGASRFSIRGRLQQKGVAGELVQAALAGLDAQGEGSERVAAGALARRRRLGPYRLGEATPERRRKELAALARAGFGLALARHIVEAPDSETLEGWMRGEVE